MKRRTYLMLFLITMMGMTALIAPQPADKTALLTAGEQTPNLILTPQTISGGRSADQRLAVSEYASAVKTWTDGSSGTEWVSDVVVDENDSVYVFGYSNGPFPTTSGAYQEAPRGSWDCFIARLHPTTLAVQYATLIGGEYGDYGFAIAVNDYGVHIAGYTDDYIFIENGWPTTPDANSTTHAGNYDLFYAVVSHNLSTLIYSTYFGGFESDYAYDLALDESGLAWIVGSTESDATWPSTAGALNDTTEADRTVFLCAHSAVAGWVNYSSYVGGFDDWNAARSLVISEDNSSTIPGEVKVGIAGLTTSDRFPVSAGAYDTYYTPGSGRTVFFFEHSCDSAWNGAKDYATYLGTGGQGTDEWDHPHLSHNGSHTYALGVSTTAQDWPTSLGAYQSYSAGGYDGWVVHFRPDLTGSDFLRQGTYLGGSSTDYITGVSFDLRNNLLISGATRSSDWPTRGLVAQGKSGTQDAVVAQLGPVSNSWGAALNFSSVHSIGDSETHVTLAVTGNNDAVTAGHGGSPQDAGVVRWTVPDNPRCRIISANEPDEAGETLRVVVNASALNSYSGSEIEEVELRLWTSDDGSDYRTVSSDESDDETVPEIYTLTTSVREGEAGGELHYYVTAYAQDYGYRRHSREANITGEAGAGGDDDDGDGTLPIFGEYAAYTLAAAWLSATTLLCMWYAGNHLEKFVFRRVHIVWAFAAMSMVALGVVVGALSLSGVLAAWPIINTVALCAFGVAWASVSSWKYAEGEHPWQGFFGILAAGLAICFLTLVSSFAAFTLAWSSSWPWMLVFAGGAVTSALLLIPKEKIYEIKGREIPIRGISYALAAVVSTIAILQAFGLFPWGV